MKVSSRKHENVASYIPIHLIRVIMTYLFYSDRTFYAHNFSDSSSPDGSHAFAFRAYQTDKNPPTRLTFLNESLES